jgi:stage II sporulation protein D
MRRGLAVAALALLAGGQSGPAALAAQDSRMSSGEVRVGFLRNGSYEVVAIPFETYVGRVLAGEAARDSPPAALEALAIAIRTYAVGNRTKHAADGFELCDQTHCQVVRTANEWSERAARVTAGQVLLFDGAPASVFYSASCGGRTERPSSVWPGVTDTAYLPVQADDACEGQPEWTAELRLADLQRVFLEAGHRGTLRAVRILSRNDSGRVARLGLEGLTPGEVSGQDLRMAVMRVRSLPQVMSAAFELTANGDSYRFSGHGYGHGVGMCVIGSVKLAARGVSAADILYRYYPGTSLSAGGGDNVTVTGSDDNSRGALIALAARARDDLTKALAVNAPPRVEIRAHSSSAEYERATGQSWFTFGSFANRQIHLVPIATLQDRGILERIVRRQIARMLTEPELAGKPLWVLEGAALHFGDPTTGAAADRPAVTGPCPSDDELAHALSPGALADAYARARACFDRQLASGRSWREIR